MKSGILRIPLFLPAIALAGAIGASLPMSTAVAQVSPGEKVADDPAASKPGVVSGVVVNAPRPESKLQQIPPDKKAAFAEEAAKSEVWKRYRKSTPSVTEGTLGQAKDYPGLQSLLPQPDDAASAAPAAVR
jgi:hypothetical protein